MDSRGEKSLLDDLLIRCEELNDQGRPVTIEDLCVEHPELVKELRRRDEALRDEPAAQPAHHEFGGERAVGAAGTGPVSAAAIGLLLRDLPRPGVPRRGGAGRGFHGARRGHEPQGGLEVPQKAEGERCREPHRFLMEAEITGRLEHPGIVPVYSLGQDNEGHPCYAMRFIRGETLEDEIHRFHESGGGPSEHSPGLHCW